MKDNTISILTAFLVLVWIISWFSAIWFSDILVQSDKLFLTGLFALMLGMLIIHKQE